MGAENFDKELKIENMNTLHYLSTVTYIKVRFFYDYTSYWSIGRCTTIRLLFATFIVVHRQILKLKITYLSQTNLTAMKKKSL